MERVIAEEFARLEEQRERWMTALRGCDERVRGYRPTDGTWSMMDVTEHLVRVEEAFAAEGRLRRNDAPRKVSANECVRALIVRMVMRSPLKVKTPRTAEMVVPKGAGQIDEVETEWVAARRELRGLVEGVGRAEMRRQMFRHPVSGGLTAVQMMRFVSAHLRHHEYQVSRLRKLAGPLA